MLARPDTWLADPTAEQRQRDPSQGFAGQGDALLSTPPMRRSHSGADILPVSPSDWSISPNTIGRHPGMLPSRSLGSLQSDPMQRPGTEASRRRNRADASSSSGQGQGGQRLWQARLAPLERNHQEPSLADPHQLLPPRGAAAPGIPLEHPLSPGMSLGTAFPSIASHDAPRTHVGKHGRKHKHGARHGVPAPLDHQALNSVSQLEALPISLGGGSSSSSNTPLRLDHRSRLGPLQGAGLDPFQSSGSNGKFVNGDPGPLLAHGYSQLGPAPQFSRVDLLGKEVERERNAAIDNAAVTIQAGYRGWACRRKCLQRQKHQHTNGGAHEMSDNNGGHHYHEQHRDHPSLTEMRQQLLEGSKPELHEQHNGHPSQSEMRQQTTRMLLEGFKQCSPRVDHGDSDNLTAFAPPQDRIEAPSSKPSMVWSPRWEDVPWAEVVEGDPDCARHRAFVDARPATAEVLASPRNSESSGAESDAPDTHFDKGVCAPPEEDELSDASAENWVFESDAGRRLTAACQFAPVELEEDDSDLDTEVDVATACAGNAVRTAYGAFGGPGSPDRSPCAGPGSPDRSPSHRAPSSGSGSP